KGVLARSASMRSPASLNSLLVIPMDLLPCRAERSDVRYELRLHARQFPLLEAKVAAKIGWPIRAVQIEERFLTSATYMHVSGAMVAGVNHDAKPVNSQQGRHGKKNNINPSDWVYREFEFSFWLCPKARYPTSQKRDVGHPMG